MAVTGNEAVTLSQLRTAIEGGGTLSDTTSGADGTEAVRLSQLKLVMDNVNVVKEYSIYGWLVGSTQASAVPGSVVVIGNGETVGTSYIYEAENGEPTSRRICSSVYVNDLSKAPKIVQEAFAAIPTTYAPPPTITGYSWFIMPCCDVFVQPI